MLDDVRQHRENLDQAMTSSHAAQHQLALRRALQRRLEALDKKFTLVIDEMTSDFSG